MRKAVGVVSLALLVGAVGCGRQEATRSPERDLTLQTPAPPVVAIASPVELARPAAQSPRVVRKAPRHHRVPAPARPTATAGVPAVPEHQPVPIPEPVAEPTAQPLVDAVVPAGGGRELAPGETVTVIPVSAGPSSSEGDEVGLPVEPARGGIFIGRGGGTCRPRGGVRGFRIEIR